MRAAFQSFEQELRGWTPEPNKYTLSALGMFFAWSLLRAGTFSVWPLKTK